MKYTGRIVAMSIFMLSSACFKINDFISLGYIPIYEFIYSAIWVLPIWWAGKKYDESKFYFKQLQQTEEKYRIITENVYDLIKIIDKEGIIKYASPSHQKLLGNAPDEYIGKHLLHGIHPDYTETILSMLSSFNPKNAHLLPYTVQRQHQNGSWIWLETYAQPLLDTKGNVQQFILTSRDITEKKNYEERLKELAFHDSLTNLPNRRLFKEKVTQSIREAERYNRKMAVMYIDIDDFKPINDQYGHDIGDELLKQFALRIKGCIRKADVVARLGGDEFVVLLSEIRHQEDSQLIAGKIMEVLRQPWVIKEYTFVTTSCIGIAIYEKSEDYYSIMKRADMALYQAKKTGKNNFITSDGFAAEFTV
ncbi:GGDEF domain-containing protein [Bacillus sp. BRMEA1]|uniref:sensor domain-containing diguanylate cyclase n=1 Tax=Neobacillus endophyticus TaxID=2738405 RepID=UPI00156654F4|nr:sensor domain-containing diguanylate cyclase [Neobacillus endophyticus]NRD77123.1 GGDEF domain-containing protein [Neobacillus endophyticus]